MFSSFLRSDSGAPKPGQQSNKVDMQAARKTARSTCAAQHNLVKPFQESVNQCRTSQYITYGWRLSSSLTFFGTAMAISNRFPQAGVVGPVFAALGGFWVGGIFHQVHITWLQAKLIKQIDSSLAVLEKADVTHGSNIGVPEYREAIDVLTKHKTAEVQQAKSTSAMLAGFGLGGGAGDDASGGQGGGAGSATSADGHRLVLLPGQTADPLEIEAQRIIADYDRRQAIKRGIKS